MKRFYNNDFNEVKKAKVEYEDIIPKNKLKKHYLDINKTSYIKCLKLEENDGLSFEEFQQVWNLKPENKLQIKVGEKLIDCPRYTKNYLRAYHFSGLERDAEKDLPENIRKIFNYAKSKNSNLNQCLVNWYESDGGIGKHSDNTSQLIKDSEIFSFSFGPAKRYFYIEPKDESEINKSVFRIPLENNTLVIMGGKCQSTHIHHVPKVKNDQSDARRINFTFRCFKD